MSKPINNEVILKPILASMVDSDVAVEETRDLKRSDADAGDGKPKH